MEIKNPKAQLGLVREIMTKKNTLDINYYYPY